MIKILFVTAEPTDLSRLRLGKEYRVVEESRKLSKHGDKFTLKHSPATRHLDFVQELIDFGPDIVHFSGHGSKGGICLENDAGESTPALPRDLEGIFEHLGGKISCVVLNSCYSSLQADAILPYVHDVISTRTPIGDDMALGFSGGFYRGLANGHDVPAAFQLGCSTAGDKASRRIFRHDRNPDGVSLDLRFPEHLPVMIGMRCSRDQFEELTRDAREAMAGYDFSEEQHREQGLRNEDYSFYYEPLWLPTDADEWKRAIFQGCDIVAKIGRAISEPKVYHFFMRAPACYAIGLGAALGTKQEAIIHHHQKSPSRLAYTPVVKLTVPATGGRGPQIVKLQPNRDFRHISTEGTERPAHKMYAALDFAPNRTKGVDELARKDRAGFAHIISNHGGDIPLDADWLQIARETTTVLLTLLAEGCRELHLFPSAPVPLAFAIGMGLDTRSNVAVHQWLAEGNYPEVFRLNQLVPTRA